MGETVDKERLIALLEPALAAMGFELADLDAHLGRRGLLRLFIDREGGVTVDDCAAGQRAARSVARRRGPAAGQLRARGVVAGFRSAAAHAGALRALRGEPAKVELKDARDGGRRSFTGRL